MKGYMPLNKENETDDTSTESDFYSSRENARTAIDRLKISLKKIKEEFFQCVAISVLTYFGTIWTLTKHLKGDMGTMQGCFVLLQ